MTAPDAPKSSATEATGLPRPVRSALHLWFRLRRGMTLGVRAVVIREEREIFLLRHTYVAGWQFPDGGVEPGETLEEALAKELREEAGIVPLGRPALHGVVRNRTSSERDHVAVYVVRTFSEGPVPRSMEIAEGRFFPLDALPEGMTPGTRRRLDEVLAGLPAAQEW